MRLSDREIESRLRSVSPGFSLRGSAASAWWPGATASIPSQGLYFNDDFVCGINYDLVVGPWDIVSGAGRTIIRGWMEVARKAAMISGLYESVSRAFRISFSPELPMKLRRCGCEYIRNSPCDHDASYRKSTEAELLDLPGAISHGSFSSN